MSWRHEKVPGQRPLESDQSLHLTAPELKTPPPQELLGSSGGEGRRDLEEAQEWRAPR